MLIQLVTQENRVLQQINYEDAQKIAKIKGLNLVKMNNSCVYKLVDIGKQKYLKKKEESKRRLSNKIVKKHIDFKSNIGENDFEIKLKTIKHFVVKGYKVSVVAKYLRSVTLFDIYNKFVEKLSFRLKQISCSCIGPNISDNGDNIFLIHN